MPIKHSDIKLCSVCGGKKTVLIKFAYTCSHCHGTGFEPVRIKIDVPEGYEYCNYYEHDKAIFEKCFDYLVPLDCKQIEVDIPYQVGQNLELVCDACGGYGMKTYCKGCEYLDGMYCLKLKKQLRSWKSQVAIAVCPNCPSCNGKGRAKIKVKEIEVANNEFVIYISEIQ